MPTVVYEDFRGEADQDLFTRLLTQVQVKSQCTAHDYDLLLAALRKAHTATTAMVDAMSDGIIDGLDGQRGLNLPTAAAMVPSATASNPEVDFRDTEWFCAP